MLYYHFFPWPKWCLWRSIEIHFEGKSTILCVAETCSPILLIISQAWQQGNIPSESGVLCDCCGHSVLLTSSTTIFTSSTQTWNGLLVYVAFMSTLIWCHRKWLYRYDMVHHVAPSVDKHQYKHTRSSVQKLQPEQSSSLQRDRMMPSVCIGGAHCPLVAKWDIQWAGLKIPFRHDVRFIIKTTLLGFIINIWYVCFHIPNCHNQHVLGPSVWVRRTWCLLWELRWEHWCHIVILVS